MYGAWSWGFKTSRPRGRPKKTWKEVVREDCQARKLKKEDAMDCCKWRKVIKEAWWSGWVWVGECFFWYRPTRVVPDQRALNGRCSNSKMEVKSVQNSLCIFRCTHTEPVLCAKIWWHLWLQLTHGRLALFRSLLSQIKRERSCTNLIVSFFLGEISHQLPKFLLKISM